MPTLSFGEFIKSKRKECDLTQKQVCVLAGTAESHVSRIENGTREPTLSLAIRLCDALGADINEYVSLTKEHTLR